MKVSLAILLIYLSFVLDFVVWPIGSEASTQALTKEASSFRRIGLWLVFIVSLAGYLAPLVIALIGWSDTAFNTWNLLSIIGVSGAIFGRVITTLGALTLKSSQSNLKTKSIFSFSRNPISLGMYVTFLGLILTCSEWWLLVAFIFYMINIDLKITLEERALVTKYGRPYIEYKSKTPRYLLV